MQYAGLLGKASKIASTIYRLLPQREHGFYRRLTGMAMQLLKQGRLAEEVFVQLYRDFIQPAPEAPLKDRVSNRLLSGATLHTRGEFPKAKGIFNRQLKLVFRHEPAEGSGRSRRPNSSFSEELLRELFLKPPEEQETEEAFLADHSSA